MKKRDLRKLALLGLASGLLVSSSSFADDPNGEDPSENPLMLAQQKTLMAANKCKGPNGCPGLIADRNRFSSSDENDPNSENMNYHLLTEDEILLELNEKGRALYNQLDQKGKKLARKVASQACNGTNECSGLNGCQTDQNDCAGQGSCKGTSKCSISDKNLAVKLVVDKLAKKRNNALKNSRTQE